MRKAAAIAAIWAFSCLAQEPAKVDLYAHFDTSMGEIVARLFPERNPITVENFIALAEGTKATLSKEHKLVRRPFYDGLQFHRIIKGFIIQAGLVQEGLACGTAAIPDEMDSARTFAQPGALAMATAGHPNSAHCEFFITVEPHKELDGQFTMFGQVVSGLDVAQRISEVKLKGEKPAVPVILNHVTIERRPR